MRYLTDVLSDGRVAIRALGRQRLFAAMAILSMTIGIGANTAIFAVANALLFRGPAGVSQADGLVDIGTDRDNGGLNPTSFPKYVAVRDRARGFDGVYARQMFLERLTIESAGGGAPVRGYADVVTLNYFNVLGLRPAFGRLFVASDPEAVGAASIAVLSYRYWMTHFNQSDKVIGETLRLNGQPFTIVGVAPDGFQGTGLSAPDLWVPVTAKPVVAGGSDAIFRNSNADWLMMGARLKPGVISDAASAEVLAIGRAIDLDTAATAPRPLRAIPSSLFPGNRRTVAFVMFAYTVRQRTQELGIRLALGATTTQVRGLVLRQPAVILAAGLAVGIGGAIGLGRWLSSPAFQVSPSDPRIMVLTAGLLALTGLLSAWLPARRASRVEPKTAMREE